MAGSVHTLINVFPNFIISPGITSEDGNLFFLLARASEQNVCVISQKGFKIETHAQ